MKLTKKIARNVIFPLIVGLGLERIFTLNKEKKVINLIFHGVVNADCTYYCPRHIEIKQFERLLRYFQKNFDIISLDTAFEWKSKGIQPKRNTLTVSFDDGYLNNLSIALPLLEKYKIPTTICVSSLCLQKEIAPLLWHDVIDGMNYFYPNTSYIFDSYEILNLFDTKSGRIVYDIVVETNHHTRDSELLRLINEYNLIEKFKSLPEEIWKLMNEEEVKILSNSSLITIASHGHYHYNLGMINIDKAKFEFEHSKTLLEETIQKKIDMFAYPDGNYTLELKELAFASGYSKQLAVPFHFHEDFGDPRILSRQGISSTTTYASNVFFLNKSFR